MNRFLHKIESIFGSINATLSALTFKGSELFDVKLLLITIFSTVATWFLFLAWDHSLFIPGADALSSVPHLKEMLTHSWDELLYRFELQGGILLHSISGYYVFIRFCGLLGFSLTWSVNLLVFIMQSLAAYFCLKALIDFTIFQEDIEFKKPLSLFYILILSVLSVFFSFNPLIGWRIANGHLMMIIGLLPFISTISIILAIRNSNITLTLVLAAVFVDFQCFALGGQQMFVYSVIFGAPFLVGLLLTISRSGESDGVLALSNPFCLTVAVCIFIPLISFLLAFPMLYQILGQAFSSEYGRSAVEQSVVYSYARANPFDWLYSIMWSFFNSTPERSALYNHEINYPIGPLIILLFFLKDKRLVPLLFGMLVSVAISMLFIFDVGPISSAILDIFPFLKGFRVPERSIVPLIFILPIFSLSVVLVNTVRNFGASPFRFIFSPALLLFPFAVLIIFLPPAIREGLSWTLVIALIYFIIYSKHKPFYYIFTIILALAFSDIAAFRERLNPYTNIESILKQAEQSKGQIYSQSPELKSALTRAKFDFVIPELHVNTPWMLEISSISGYWHPIGRFSKLIFALKNIRYRPTENYFDFREDDEPAYVALRQMYNLKYSITLRDEDNFRILYTGPTSGEAWFAGGITFVQSWSDLSTILKAPGSYLFEELKKSIYLLNGDKIKYLSNFIPDTGCDASRVIQLTAEHDSQQLTVIVNNQGNCPLVIATNFTPFLKCYGYIGERGPIILDTFPAYGTLLGVIVPQGIDNVSVKASSSDYDNVWSLILRYWGYVSLAGIVIIILIAKLKHLNTSPRDKKEF